jgi:phosphopantothenoylcysteine decarboxylase / phosphopantothenate---cysteine ligase
MNHDAKTPDPPPLAGRRVVLGITGGIAAYKAAELTRLLTKAGAGVRVVMTEAATRFITPLTLQTLSGAPVAHDLFDPASEAEIGHIRIADEADLVVIAPATADAIGRMAAGLGNDLLTAVVLATRAPVLLAPAMNVNMWQHPLVQANLTRLIGTGRVHTVGPDRGELACGWIGEGRLIEPSDILAETVRLLAGGRDLAGVRVVVTAGPTREPVDDVRFLGNRSSGKMGAAVAEVAAARGAEVTLVAGPADVVPEADVVVMAAAVADFRPRTPVSGKLSRRTPGGDVSLALVPVPDLLAGLAQARRGARPYLVGFAAETAGGDALANRAAGKLDEKGCDAMVANDVSAPGIGFGADDNEVTVLFSDGAHVAIPRAPKRVIADRLWTLLAPRVAAGRTAPAEVRGGVPAAVPKVRRA